MKTYDALIVGTGQGGAQTAVSLRQLGFEGSIGMIGEEPDPPYERPPLSKAYLAGEILADKLLLRTPQYWPQNRVDLIASERVTSIDAGTKSVTCNSGKMVGYHHLVWAAGGKPRVLGCEGAQLAGVHLIRTRAQVDALRQDVASASRIVVIGGGYIGLEAAAVLVKAGKSVTVIEAQDRVLARVTSAEVSKFYEAEHRAHHVEMHTSAAVLSLQGSNGRVSGVRLSDGTELPADVVVVGIGLVPEVGPLEIAGAICSNGVEVDERCRTTVQAVYAIGDCANHSNRFADGRRVRLESVQNAVDQAKVAAANIAGIPTNYTSVPWFWSNQYDLKLQTVGILAGHDQTVVRGEPGTRSFSVVYMRNGQVIALDCINAPRDFVHGKKLVAEEMRVPISLLADPQTDLRHVTP